MSIKVKSIILDAYKRIGRMADQATDLDAARTAIGSQELNDLVQRLNIEEYFPFTIKRIELPINQLKFAWTIGTSGSDFNIDRPIKISSLYFKPSAAAIAVNIYQCSVNDIDLYKVGSQSSGMPRYFSYDAGYPEGTIFFNIMPQVNSILSITYNNALPFYDINDTITIPPEYHDLLKWCLAYNLAVRAGMDQGDTQNMLGERNRAMNAIKAKNSALKKRNWNMQQYGTANNILNLGVY